MLMLMNIMNTMLKIQVMHLQSRIKLMELCMRFNNFKICMVVDKIVKNIRSIKRLPHKRRTSTSLNNLIKIRM